MRSRTYRYFTGEPLFRFGDGLSYTKFQYRSKLGVTTLAAGEVLPVETTVTNTGKLAGDEVVEVYLTPPPSAVSPLRQLVSFERVHLAPGESRTFHLSIAPRQLSEVDAQGKRSVSAGAYRLYVGGSQPSGNDPGLPFAITGVVALQR
jgi:beta-glucosidase